MPQDLTSAKIVDLGERNTYYPGDYADENLTYDTSGRVTEAKGRGQVSGSAASLFDYTYNYKNGTLDTNHIQTRTDSVTGNSVTYTYTDQDRLFTATEKNSGGTVTNVRTYCYDKNGNRTVAATGSTSVYSCSGTLASSWDGANQQLTGPEGAASLFTFDLDGDETSTATALPAASTTRQTTWTDSQQAAQLQIGSTFMETNTYIGAGNDQLTTTGTGPTSQDQTFNTITGIDSVARYTGSSLVSSFSAIRDPAGQLLALQDNSSSARYYPLYDNQGSVLRLVDALGNTVDAYSYDPYGTRTTSTNSYPQPFGYTGAYTNPTTGLIHYGARFYDPTLGRFTQPDPQTHPGDTTQSSPYPYASNDPINNTDPTGRCGVSSFSDFGDCVSGAFDDATSTANKFALDGAKYGALGGAFAGFFTFGPPGVIPGAIGGAVNGAGGGYATGFAIGTIDYFTN